jgi:glycosyltransferase involved in cell wall biosynthesis
MNSPRLLYIASAGIREPLIVSQVVRYLKRMRSDLDCCHLLTLERNPFTDQEFRTIASDLSNEGINWHVIRARKGFRLVNLWREIFDGYLIGKSLIRKHDLNVIHARSFIPGQIGLKLSRGTGAKLLYDMRGFWAEEKLAKGTIQSRGVFQFAQYLEDRLFKKSHALVSLTEAGKRRLEQRGITTPIEVIPCCVDTDLFLWDGLNRGQLRTVISTGSLGAGYLPEAVFGIFAAIQKKLPDTKLVFLTQSNPSKIDRMAVEAGCNRSNIDVFSCPPEQVPQYLAKADVGLCMIEPSSAKIASSPTKLAEYLACGLPFIGNCDGIGDMKSIVDTYRVGVDVSALNNFGYVKAVDDVMALMSDSNLSQRCRETAKDFFSVEFGTEKYLRMYRRILCENAGA